VEEDDKEEEEGELTGTVIKLSAIKSAPSKCKTILPSKCPPTLIAVTPSTISSFSSTHLRTLCSSLRFSHVSSSLLM
jgi:hypothetical protein